MKFSTKTQVLPMKNDDPLPPFLTSPMSSPKRSHVCQHHAHMLKLVCAWCRVHTGTFWTGHTGFFQCVTPHTTTATTHNNTRRQSQGETGRREDERGETRQDKRREKREETREKIKDKRQDKRRGRENEEKRKRKSGEEKRRSIEIRCVMCVVVWF